MGDHDLDQVRFPRRITDAATARPSHAEPPVVGKSSATQSLPSAATQPVAGSNGIYASPGNMWNTGTLAPPAPVKTGVPLADRGLGCLPVGEEPLVGACFLHPTQRQMLLSSYLGNVNAAQAEYLDAVSDLKVEELLRKEPDQSDLLLEMFLDVITLAIGASVRMALRRLIGGADDVLAIVSDQQRVIDELSTVTETGIIAVLTGASTKVRDTSKERSSDARARTDKAGAVAFLDHLKAQAVVRYTDLRLRGPAGASDAQLLVIYRAFERENGHTSAGYSHHLRAKLAGFRNSGIATMGIKRNPNAGKPIAKSDPSEPGGWEIATQAFWVNTPIGRRLALYRRRHVPTPDWVASGPTGIGRKATMDDRQKFERDSLQSEPFQFYKYVSDDLVPPAVQMHIARWGTQPNEHAFGVPELEALGLVVR